MPCSEGQLCSHLGGVMTKCQNGKKAITGDACLQAYICPECLGTKKTY